MENLSIAFELLLVGMSTVFCVLIIVILLGKSLIAFSNKYLPVAAKSTANILKNEPSSDKVAAIKAAISIVTGGKGHVIKVEKK